MRQTNLTNESKEYVARREVAADLLTPVYNVLDLTPAGRGDWYAELSYER
jgi:predicted dithiol-disulfide oxidoreductase (DUF899 family)